VTVPYKFIQRERNKLGVEDLRYHDLRRKGASHLFEKGYSIEEVAQVTGHINLNILCSSCIRSYSHTSYIINSRYNHLATPKPKLLVLMRQGE
jgi:hypothetical protein